MMGDGGKCDITVIVPTLLRGQLQRTIDSVWNQQVRPQLLVRHDPEVNEYVSRDYAVTDAETSYLAFVDDDAYYEPGVLRKAIEMLQSYDIVDGSIQGNIFGRGNQRLDMPYLGVGTALFINRRAYNAVGGFDTQWGKDPSDGWRMDTSLLYKVIEKFGDDAYHHSSDMVITHPEPMQSQWNPYIEWANFYREHKSLTDKHIIPLDSRLQDMVAHSELLDDAVSTLSKQEFNHIVLRHHRGIVVESAYTDLRDAVNRKKEAKRN